VQAVVMGRIVQRGDQLIVSSELIDVRTNRNLWGDRYDRKMADLIGVQQDITGAISAHLRERLGDVGGKKAASHGETSDPEAYQLYLKGRYYWEKRTQNSLTKSKDYFIQAIEKDPSYALAHVGLASYYFVVPDYAPVSNAEMTPKVRVETEKALAIDPNMAEGHALLAGAYWNEWKWEDAEREFKRAIELNPNYADVHHWYGLYLSWMGRGDEAIAEMKRALALDPLNLRFNTNLGQAYWNARQDELAIEQLKKTAELDPNFADVHGFSAVVYRNLGNYEAWLGEWKKNTVLNGDEDMSVIVDKVKKIYQQSGYRAAVLKNIELQLSLSNHRYIDPFEFATNYAEIEDADAVFLWWNKAVDGKSGNAGAIRIFRVMDRYRSDPRYAALLKRMGLQ